MKCLPYNQRKDNFTAIFPPVIILKGFRRRNDPSSGEAVAAGAAEDTAFLSLSPPPTDSKLIACRSSAGPRITYPIPPSVILTVLIIRDLRRRSSSSSFSSHHCARLFMLTLTNDDTTSAMQSRPIRSCRSRSIDVCYCYMMGL